jgi:hypothetical protein
MLTDIFAYRYLKYPIWPTYTEEVRRLLNQTIALAKEAIPYYDAKGEVIEASKVKWESIHGRLARELGLSELSQRYYSFTPANTAGRTWPMSGFFSWDHVCEKFVVAMPSPATSNVDGFIKERISFIELVMRLREEEIAQLNARLPHAVLEAQLHDIQPHRGARIPGSAVDGVKAWNATQNATFARQVEELNERFRRAGAPLSYHNGYIQVAIDQVIEKQVARPFWDLVADPCWSNVDIDMKEALDRRDSNDKDPALFAAKALESAIKIVSDVKGWTRGTENGAAAYIDNLISKNNGSFLAPWEGEMLKDYFRKVRNFLGHGPGSEPMPTLSPPQTDWAIETAMSWVRSIVRRM